MENKNNNQSNPPHKSHDKGTDYLTQKKRVFEAFKSPATMLMVSRKTRVLRANICRYVAEWEREGSIMLIKQGVCKISKHRAGYYTTSPELFPYNVEPLNSEKR